MRILHVCRPAVGGIQRWLIEMLPRLEKAGFSLGLAAPNSVHEAIPDVPWHPWEVPDRPSHNDPILSLRLLMISRNYDVVHIHGLRCFGAACIFPTNNMILTLHNMPPAYLGRVKSKLFLRGLARCSQVICVSQAVLRAWVELFPQCKSICSVLPGGVPAEDVVDETRKTEITNRLKIDGVTPLLLCVARLMPDKGIDLLIQAMAQVPDIRAVIVGDGPDMDSLKSMAERLVPGRVLFEGHQRQIAEYLAVADIACMPSRREGQGLFPLEAMRAELPVIASDSGGLPESVTDGLTGWLFHAGEIDDLVRVLFRALRQRDQWQAMGRVGKVDVATRFNWDTLCDKLTDIYTKTVRSLPIDS